MDSVEYEVGNEAAVAIATVEEVVVDVGRGISSTATTVFIIIDVITEDYRPIYLSIYGLLDC